MNVSDIHLIPDFILRTPLLSWKAVEEFLNLTDEEKKIQKLLEIFSDPIVKEALYVASRNLYNELDNWLKAPESVKGKDKEKLAQTLVKYFFRMATRSTPFGLFAGTTHGKWNKTTAVSLPDRGNSKRYLSMDMDYLYQIRESLLEKFKSVGQPVRYHSNSTLFELGARKKFVHYQYTNSGRRFGISNVASTDYLDRILEQARFGEYAQSLIEMLSKDTDVSIKDATEYIQQLIDKQILVSELEPKLTTGYYFNQLLGIVERVAEKYPEIKNIAADFRSIDGILKLHHDKPLSTHIMSNGNPYSELSFKEISPNRDAFIHYQVDLIKPATICELAYPIATSIRKGMEAISKLTRRAEHSSFNTFRDKFKERYEGQEIPLIEALDPETGILYHGGSNIADFTPLLEEIQFEGTTQSRRIYWDKIDSFFFRKILEAREKQRYSIELADEDLKDFQSDWTAVPESFNVMFSVLESENPDEPLIHLLGGAAASGINIFSRITHLDPRFEELASRVARIEDSLNPEALVTEMVHLPDTTRMGNIMQRSFSRKYETPFLALSNKSRDHIIEIQDLMLSIKNNKLRLRSKQHQREVIVKLTTTHNFKFDTHPVYNFLGDLQYQDLQWPAALTFGPLENEYKFLPRWVYKNILISLATWQLTSSDYAHIVSQATKKEKIYRLGEFIKKWMLPRFITISDADNHLLIDLNNKICIDILLDTFAKQESVRLREFMKPSRLICDDQGQPYCNEGFALFSRAKPSQAWTFGSSEKHSIQREFALGDDWIYYKLYTGTKGADALLTGPIARIAGELASRKFIDKWFFIRYYDSDYHIRVRFHLTDKKNFPAAIAILSGILNPLLAAKSVLRIQTDTYRRELERYGSRSLELAESLFYIDSSFVISFLSQALNTSSGDEMRWLYCIRAVDDLFNDFGFSLDQKLKTIKAIDRISNGKSNRQIGAKYRNLTQKIEQVLNKAEETPELRFILQLQAQKSLANQPVIDAINKLRSEQQLEANISDLVASCTHMMINRICLTKPNEHEAVTYNFLNRYYTSRSVRSAIKDKI